MLGWFVKALQNAGKFGQRPMKDELAPVEIFSGIKAGD